MLLTFTVLLQLEQLSNKDHMLVPIGKTTGVCINNFPCSTLCLQFHEPPQFLVFS